MNISMVVTGVPVRDIANVIIADSKADARKHISVIETRSPKTFRRDLSWQRLTLMKETAYALL